MRKIILFCLLLAVIIVNAQDSFLLKTDFGDVTPTFKSDMSGYDIDGDGYDDILIKSGASDFNASTWPPEHITERYVVNNDGTFILMDSPPVNDSDPNDIPFMDTHDGFGFVGDFDSQNGVDYVTVGGTNLEINAPCDPQGRIIMSDPNEPTGFSYYSIIGLYDARGVMFDFDNDGDLDLIYNGLDENITKRFIVYLNNSGTFELFINTTADTDEKATDLGHITAADTDLDGDLDIINQGSQSSVYKTDVYVNNSGNFVGSGNNFPQVTSGSNPVVDINGDGFPDIIVSGITTGTTGSIRYAEIFFNDGDTDGDGIGENTFTSQGSLKDENGDTIGFTNSMSAFLDYNNDGHNDFFISGDAVSYDADMNIISGSQRQIAIVYLNDGSGGFTYEESHPGVSLGTLLIGDFDLSLIHI